MSSSNVAAFVGGGASVGLIVILAGVPELDRGPIQYGPSAGHELQQTDAGTGDVGTISPFSYAPLDPENEPIQPIPLDVRELFRGDVESDYNEAKIELGRVLFHDPRLSSDNTLACSSCHDLRYAGIDRAITATGVCGQVGPINTPTIFNAAFSATQFWDGRAVGLTDDPEGRANVLAAMDSNWTEVSDRLTADPSIVVLLVEAYPGVDFSGGVEPRHWVEAIDDFGRTLATPNAPFDRYLRGDDTAVGERVKEGYEIFKSIGCVECHHGPAVGGETLAEMGRRKPYFESNASGVDLGRFNVTGKQEDKHKFKVPNLRNVALTAPYFHDGSMRTLAEAVQAMGEYQLGQELTRAETSRLVSFLESLTGEYEGASLGDVQNTVANPTR